MDITNYLSGITTNITNQTAPKSIPGTVVGQAFTDLANLTKTNVDLKLDITGSTLFLTGATASGVTRGTSNVDLELTRIDNTAIFKGSAIDSYLPNFITDIQIAGLVVTSTDVLHVYYAWRGFLNSGVPTWVISLGINGNRVANLTVNNYVEPAADALGNIIDTWYLTPIGTYANNSGVTATVKVNWAAITSGTANSYTTTSVMLKSCISPKVYKPKLQSVVIASGVTRGSSNVDAELNRIDSYSIFQGSETDPVLPKFISDIVFTGLVVADSDVVTVNLVYRNIAVTSGATSSWILALAVNDVRVCEFVTTGYVEPSADTKGNIFDILTLPAFGSTGVSAKVAVNWAAFPNNSARTYTAATLKSVIAKKVYKKFASTSSSGATGTIMASGVTRGSSNVDAELNRLDKTDVFQGSEIDPVLLDFIQDISFTGMQVALTDKVTVYYVYRNQPPSTGAAPRWLVAIAINDTRVCQWTMDSYTEPTADAGGKIIDTLTATPLNSSGINAKIIVNWAVLPSVTFRQYSSTTQVKALISYKKIAYKLNSTGTSGKLTLPNTAVPRSIYTTFNDIDPNNQTNGGAYRADLVRNAGINLYVDRFLRDGFPLNTDVSFDITRTDRITLNSPRDLDDDVPFTHPNPSYTIPQNITINGGSLYNNRVISFNQISTLASVGSSKFVAALLFGDSTVDGFATELGVPNGLPHRAFAVIHEQFTKDKIDYLLATGYTATNIQSYLTGGTNTISTADKAKFNTIVMGTTSFDSYNLIYNGVTVPYGIYGEGRGGWAQYMYLNKPMLMIRSQGTWDILGLGDGSGTDYIATAAQMYLYDRTALTPANFILTQPARDWMTANLTFTATNTGSTTEYIARLNTLNANPTNPYYDKDLGTTINDTDGVAWAVRFSIKKFLDRYRTLDNSGNKLLAGDPTIGTNITNIATTGFNVTLPTHIIIQLAANDQDVAHFGKMSRVFTDSLKKNYTDNSFPMAKIALSVCDGSGTYFPQRYPEVDPFCVMNNGLRQTFDNNLQRAQISIPISEEANSVFLINNIFVTPTAKAVIARPVNSPEYDITKEVRDSKAMPARTSQGILIHPNAVGHRSWGVHYYNWIKYTLGLS